VGYIYIFILSISPINQIWQDSQNFWDPEMLEIFRDPQYFGSPGWSIRNFSKKSIPHDWVPLPAVKISAQTDEICGIARGKTLGRFLDLVVSGSPWRWGLANLCLWQLLLYYSRPIYPESFKNFRSAVS